MTKDEELQMLQLRREIVNLQFALLQYQGRDLETAIKVKEKEETDVKDPVAG